MWVLDFLESEWNEPVTLKKQLFVFDGGESYIIQAKLRILENSTISLATPWFFQALLWDWAWY